MNITYVSDTHGLHDRLMLTGGMVLIHAGDITQYGTEEEVGDFLDWYTYMKIKPDRVCLKLHSGEHIFKVVYKLCARPHKKSVRNILVNA